MTFSIHFCDHNSLNWWLSARINIVVRSSRGGYFCNLKATAVEAAVSPLVESMAKVMDSLNELKWSCLLMVTRKRQEIMCNSREIYHEIRWNISYSKVIKYCLIKLHYCMIMLNNNFPRLHCNAINLRFLIWKPTFSPKAMALKHKDTPKSIYSISI